MKNGLLKVGDKFYRPQYQVYHDARLVAVNDQGLVLDYCGKVVTLPTFEPPLDHLDTEFGKVGLVEWVPSSQCWRFRSYYDQSLRRVFEFDHGDRIGWRNDADPDGWTAPRCVVPGVNGAFIEDETELYELYIPPEFVQMCAEFDCDPDEVLRGFIADACGLVNAADEPRADGYCTNGSDERMFAGDYIHRAYGLFYELCGEPLPEKVA